MGNTAERGTTWREEGPRGSRAYVRSTGSGGRRQRSGDTSRRTSSHGSGYGRGRVLPFRFHVSKFGTHRDYEADKPCDLLPEETAIPALSTYDL